MRGLPFVGVRCERVTFCRSSGVRGLPFVGVRV